MGGTKRGYFSPPKRVRPGFRGGLRCAAATDGFPQDVGQFDPQKIGHDNPDLSSRPITEER
jgi:hypothetical protein